MVNDAQKGSSPNDSGTWGGPRVPTWTTAGKRVVMNLHPEVFAFVHLVAQSTKRTKRTLVLQIFMEGLRSTFGVTARDLGSAEYSTVNRSVLKPVTTIETLRQWGEDSLIRTPYVEDEQDPEFDAQ